MWSATRHSSSVLELLEILLGSGTATLALGDDLDSTLVGSGGQVYLRDLGADVPRKLQGREGCARLDELAKIILPGHRLRDVNHRRHTKSFELAYLAMDSVVLEGNVDRCSTTERSGQLVELLCRSSLSRSLLRLGADNRSVLCSR